MAIKDTNKSKII